MPSKQSRAARGCGEEADATIGEMAHWVRPKLGA
jgi:hypothetical protein